jgi:carnitine 3-dehydrogenase
MTGTAAIIGGGVIGGGWAARFLLNGWNVVVCDPDPQAERKIGEVLDNARRSLPALTDHRVLNEGRLLFTDAIADAVTEADWIQESVPERLDIKHSVFRDIQRHCRKEALLASSTSGFKPSELQRDALHPQQILVAHPFNPVYLLPLIELVGDTDTTERASGILKSLGMAPLVVRREIDAHIADRFLEAVWREGLWLIKDGIATTSEIDDAIRYGFGLRWAQMGLFETYRIAGGEAGMKHFIEQFGPCLSWPWTKLMDVPELTEELIDQIASQSDDQSGQYTIRELERIRDDNLVAIMRALKQRNQGAGAILKSDDEAKKPPLPCAIDQPLMTNARVVPVDWTDERGTMKESHYGQVISDASATVLAMVGVNAHYVDTGYTFITLENNFSYLLAAQAADALTVRTQVLGAADESLRLYHEVQRGEDLLCTCNQLLAHGSVETRQLCQPPAPMLQKIKDLARAQQTLPRPSSLSESHWQEARA